MEHSNEATRSPRHTQYEVAVCNIFSTDKNIYTEGIARSQRVVDTMYVYINIYFIYISS